MRSEIFALPLLALAYGVSASPCLPPLTSSSLSGTTTASSKGVSTVSTESSTASATESTTSSALSTASTESTTASVSETATPSATLSSTSTESTGSTTAEPTTTTTSALSTASTESTTTSAAQSTTTSTEPEPQETNLIVNGGFEASTPQPWRIFNTRNPGSLGISTEQFYVGQQSGTYSHSDNALDEYWGIYQPIDNTRLILGSRYIVSIRIRVPDNSCTDIILAPSIGGGGWMAQGSSPINVGGAVNNWYEARAVFRYNQQWMFNTEPGVAIISRCESVSFLVDEASMVQLVEPTD